MENTFLLLAQLIKRIQCKPGWRFYLVDEEDAKRLSRVKCNGCNADYDPWYTDTTCPECDGIIGGPSEPPAGAEPAAISALTAQAGSVSQEGPERG